MPRLEIRHTSAQHLGQIYLPRVNALLLVGVLLLVALFRSSSALASAYGIAVTGTMVVTGLMAFIVIWRMWRWSPLAAAALMAPFLVIDPTFLSANMLKVIEGGWVPLALGGVVMLVMYTWRRGSKILFAKTRRLETPLDDLVRMPEKKPPQRVPGTAVFLTSDPKSAPTALLHSLKHYKVLHEKNIILSVETTHTPRVEPGKRVRMEPVGSTFVRVALRFGYMETPNNSEGAGDRAQARAAVRHHVDVVLPVAPGAAPGAAVGNAVLAGPPVHQSGPLRQRCDRLFPDPDRPRRRGRHPGQHLTARELWRPTGHTAGLTGPGSCFRFSGHSAPAGRCRKSQRGVQSCRITPEGRRGCAI